MRAGPRRSCSAPLLCAWAALSVLASARPAAAEELSRFDTTGLSDVGLHDVVMVDTLSDGGREPVVVARAGASMGVYLLRLDAPPELLIALPVDPFAEPLTPLRLMATAADATSIGITPIAGLLPGPEHLLLSVAGPHDALDGRGGVAGALYFLRDPAETGRLLSTFVFNAADPSAGVYGEVMGRGGRGEAFIRSTRLRSAYDYADPFTVISATELTVWTDAGWTARHTVPGLVAHLVPAGDDEGFAINDSGAVFLLDRGRADVPSPPGPPVPLATEQLGHLGGPALGAADSGPFVVAPDGAILRLSRLGLELWLGGVVARQPAGGELELGWIEGQAVFWAADLGAPERQARAPFVVGADDQLRWLGDTDGDGCSELFVTQLAEGAALRWEPPCGIDLELSLGALPSGFDRAAAPPADAPRELEPAAPAPVDSGEPEINPLAELDPAETVFGWSCASAPRLPSPIALLGLLALGWCRRR